MLQALLLAVGVMNLKAMAALTVAIAIERTLAFPVFWTRLTGGLLIAIGTFMLVGATVLR